MFKKFLALALTLAMVLGVFTLAGCREKGEDYSNFEVAIEEFDPNTSVEITFTHTMGANLQGVLNNYIEEFNKIYPNITITHQSAGGWGDINGQINTEIAGGNQPNIAYCYPDHVAMYNIAKAVVKLDSLIESDAAVTGTDEIIGLTDAQRLTLLKVITMKAWFMATIICTQCHLTSQQKFSITTKPSLKKTILPFLPLGKSFGLHAQR